MIGDYAAVAGAIGFLLIFLTLAVIHHMEFWRSINLGHVAFLLGLAGLLMVPKLQSLSIKMDQTGLSATFAAAELAASKAQTERRMTELEQRLFAEVVKLHDTAIIAGDVAADPKPEDKRFNKTSGDLENFKVSIVVVARPSQENVLKPISDGLRDEGYSVGSAVGPIIVKGEKSAKTVRIIYNREYADISKKVESLLQYIINAQNLNLIVDREPKGFLVRNGDVQLQIF